MTICKKAPPLRVSAGFVAFLCAYYYFNPADTFYPFIIGIFLHEAGHLLLLWILKIPIYSLSFKIGGAVLDTPPLPYSQELSVAAAGPMINGLLVLVCLHQAPLFALVNLCLFTYNLLPFYPLDGGRILRSILAIHCRLETAIRMERWITGTCFSFLAIAAAYLTCICHLGLWPLVLLTSLMWRLKGCPKWPLRRASRPRRRT